MKFPFIEIMEHIQKRGFYYTSTTTIILTETGIFYFRRRAKETPSMEGHSKSTINRGGFMPTSVNQIKDNKNRKT